MAGEWIVEGLRLERKARIPVNWETYHSPSCGAACTNDCPSFMFRMTGEWNLWTIWREIRERQDLLQKQQAKIYNRLHFLIGEDNICPMTHRTCDDECCPPGAVCNLRGTSLETEA